MLSLASCSPFKNRLKADEDQYTWVSRNIVIQRVWSITNQSRIRNPRMASFGHSCKVCYSSMESSEIEIIYQDPFLLVVNKPSGWLVHRGWGRDRVVLIDWIRKSLCHPTVYPMHRLDRGTSGTVIFALNKDSATHIGQQFRCGSIKKKYLVLVRGVTDESGRIDYPISRKRGGARVHAVTEYRRLASSPTEPRYVSLIEVMPQTGRLHQIRRHLKHIDHPVIGDARYGKGRINRAMARTYGLTRLALHCWQLSILHPHTQKNLNFTAKVPDCLSKPFHRMGLVDFDGEEVVTSTF